MKALTTIRRLMLCGAVASLALFSPALADGNGHGHNRHHGHHGHKHVQKRSHVDRLYQLSNDYHASVRFKYGSRGHSISLAENVWRISDNSHRFHGHHRINRFTPQRYRHGHFNPDYYRLRHIGSSAYPGGGYGNVIYIDAGARVFTGVQDDDPSVFTKDDAETLIYGRKIDTPEIEKPQLPPRPATQEAVTVHRKLPDGSVKTIITSRPIGDENAPTALARAEAAIEETEPVAVQADDDAQTTETDQVLAKDERQQPEE